jgi:hypothetical protein
MREMTRCKVRGIISTLDKPRFFDPAAVFDLWASGSEGTTRRRIDRCGRIAFKQNAVVGFVRIQ